MKIISTKKYITETGLDVKIIKDNLRGTPWPIVICIDMQDGTDTIDFCDITGMTTGHGQLHPYGSQFKLDDPVMMRDACEPDSAARPRYFAGMINGRFATWSGGCTSWTAVAPADVMMWDYCRKPTAEESSKRQTPYWVDGA